MLTQLQLEIINPAGQVSFTTLAPEGLTTIGSHPDNQVVIEDAGVALFQAILDHRQRPCRLRRLADRGQISLDGRPLPDTGPVTLAQDSLLQLGDHLLILLDLGPSSMLLATESEASELNSHKGQVSGVQSLLCQPVKQSKLCTPVITSCKNRVRVKGLNVESTRPPSVCYQDSGDDRFETAETERPKRPHCFRWRDRLSVLSWLNLVPVIGPVLVWLAGLGLLLVSIFIVWMTVSHLQAESRITRTADVETFQDLGVQTPIVAPDFGEDRIPASRPNQSGIRTEITYEEMFREIALVYGLDWHLLAELAYQESRMDALAVGKDNDMGLMQIIPSTWEEWAPQVGVSDPFDPYSNVLVGAAYLAYVRDYCQARGRPEIHWMVVGYNWGPDNLRQLFEQNGDWAQVPARQRRYTLAILQAVSNNAVRWQK